MRFGARVAGGKRFGSDDAQSLYESSPRDRLVL